MGSWSPISHAKTPRAAATRRGPGSLGNKRGARARTPESRILGLDMMDGRPRSAPHSTHIPTAHRDRVAGQCLRRAIMMNPNGHLLHKSLIITQPGYLTLTLTWSRNGFTADLAVQPPSRPWVPSLVSDTSPSKSPVDLLIRRVWQVYGRIASVASALRGRVGASFQLVILRGSA